MINWCFVHNVYRNCKINIPMRLKVVENNFQYRDLWCFSLILMCFEILFWIIDCYSLTFSGILTVYHRKQSSTAIWRYIPRTSWKLIHNSIQKTERWDICSRASFIAFTDRYTTSLTLNGTECMTYIQFMMIMPIWYPLYLLTFILSRFTLSDVPIQ